MFRKLMHRLGLRYSPSIAWQDAGREMMRLMAEGAERGARETEGMTWEERARYVLEHTDPETFAYAEGVARRSFWTLYEDDEENVA